MNLFEIVKYGVSCREAAELYGVEVNRYGMALCPFHNDRHPSLYVADDHYYCFACGEHGDVIDFVGRLFQLSPYDAARKLMADFHLSPDKPPSAAALHAKRIRTEAQQLMENERLCFSVLSDYARVLRDWKVRYAPQSPDVPVHARFMEACHKLDETEYYLDILCVGDSHERAKVVQQIAGAMKYLDYLVPSYHEASYFTGKDSPEEIADEFHRRGVKTVVLKMGAQGVFASSEGRTYRVGTIADRVVDTLGAGDNFVAGFITGIVDGKSMEEALYFGSAASAIAISQYGASGAIKSKQQVQDYLDAHRK